MIIQKQLDQIDLGSRLMLARTVQPFKQRENVMCLGNFLHVMLQPVARNKKSDTTLAQLLQSELHLWIQLRHILLQPN
ncbi:hypothetical protein D3C73_1378260 [compost metagenome]